MEDFSTNVINIIQTLTTSLSEGARPAQHVPSSRQKTVHLLLLNPSLALLCRAFSSVADVSYLQCPLVTANTSLLPHATAISVDPSYYSYQASPLLFCAAPRLLCQAALPI